MSTSAHSLATSCQINKCMHVQQDHVMLVWYQGLWTIQGEKKPYSKLSKYVHIRKEYSGVQLVRLHCTAYTKITCRYCAEEPLYRCSHHISFQIACINMQACSKHFSMREYKICVHFTNLQDFVITTDVIVFTFQYAFSDTT